MDQKITPTLRSPKEILARALGMSEMGYPSQRNHFVAPAGTEHHEVCLALVGAGLMTGGADDGNFRVTPAGAAYAQSTLLSHVFDSLVADRVSEEASIEANERVGPNSFEFEGLCSSLEEDPKVILRATESLCKRLLKLSGDWPSCPN